ncbi:glucose-1-phosphate adenylyltransferase [Clostridium acetireducens DSM 10703]|jgi:glucose-1-phosphate adenylyltransferase|uniref:Glucose-1-phosphate adenylyltransferase n=1 Tax=Clostridium acetireducens DSM 10703 TaxID=1121290 RepID=A0A1E8F009_9CLOT|nr:glucose-1-phosphate adenylyltransferase [Clostridium acetireducens]OFI06764.1 glucose-1-phosphate adenylyltransferase [Clostridium acetireducens DSM 10703]
MKHKECIAMILAGGQGSRLKILTKKLAKPAVYFGGKYRIIDFTLSNCSNSGIDTVGVLTQYEPLILNSYIGIGSPWDLDVSNGGVTVLPPYAMVGRREWYKGTANSVYQNINFIDEYSPLYVIILSGDHVYKMDYSKMLDYHKEKGAEATIAVIKVDFEEASRFGIMNTDSHNKILEFEEKPKNPKNNLASMGIYIFNWELLKYYLIKDEINKNSNHDFGKDIIPKIIKDNRKAYAYNFEGYWKDVGTIESFWESNMDLLCDNPKLNLYDTKWKIYSVNPTKVPNYIGNKSKVTNSLVNEGCIIHGNVENSVIFPGVYIEEGSFIKHSVIMPNVKIDRNVIIEKSIIGEEAVIEEGASIGKSSDNIDEYLYEKIDSDITVIGGEVTVLKESQIPKGIVVASISEDYD